MSMVENQSKSPTSMVKIAMVGCAGIIVLFIAAFAAVTFWYMSIIESELTVDDGEIQVIDSLDVVSVGTFKLEPDEAASVSIATDQATRIGCRVVQVFDEDYKADHTVHAIALEDESGDSRLSASVGGGMKFAPRSGKITVRVRNLLDVPIEAEVNRRK
jgi:hypothetical protein